MLNAGGTLKRRSKGSQSRDVENQKSKQEEEKMAEQCEKKTFKYYFNRFRYYHYCIAEKVDTFIGIICMAIIKAYFFLMGWDNQFVTEDNGTMSLMDMDDE